MRDLIAILAVGFVVFVDLVFVCTTFMILGRFHQWLITQP